MKNKKKKKIFFEKKLFFFFFQGCSTTSDNNTCFEVNPIPECLSDEVYNQDLVKKNKFIHNRKKN
jgi:hypothetical protein